LDLNVVSENRRAISLYESIVKGPPTFHRLQAVGTLYYFNYLVKE